MVRRRISEAQRWQIIGMHTTGMSFKAIGRQMGYHYTVVSRLVRKHTQTNNVKDLPRSGRPRVTSDRALQRLVRRCHSQPVPYSNNTGCPIYVCQQEQLETVWNQPDLSQGVIKRPLLADRHRPDEGLETQKYSLYPRNIQPTVPCGGGSVMVSNCSCWQTSIGQPVLFEYGTGCEWHPSNQTLQCPVVTIRCYPWSAGS